MSLGVLLFHGTAVFVLLIFCFFPLFFLYICFFCFFMEFHGISCGFMGFHGVSWDFMDLHGSSWIFMGLHGSSWVFMGFHGISWVFMGLHGISCDVLCFFSVCFDHIDFCDFAIFFYVQYQITTTIFHMETVDVMVYNLHKVTGLSSPDLTTVKAIQPRSHK